jgi:hypothetical protein
MSALPGELCWHFITLSFTETENSFCDFVLKRIRAWCFVKNCESKVSKHLTLAVVYAGTDELDLAFEQLEPAAKIPNGVYHGDLKLVPY